MATNVIFIKKIKLFRQNLKNVSSGLYREVADCIGVHLRDGRFFLPQIIPTEEVESMFYVKEKLGETTEVAVKITAENVFCKCPRCQAEVPVDLMEFMGDKDFELYDSAVYCDNCVELLKRGV